MAQNQTSTREDDRPFCFLFRFNVSPGLYIHSTAASRRAQFRQGVSSTPGAKSGLQGCQGPLKAASTNLCPGWTSQIYPTTDRHSSKCRATAPSIWGQHSWGGSIACLGRGPEARILRRAGRKGNGPNGATLPTGRFQEPRMECNSGVGASMDPLAKVLRRCVQTSLGAAVTPASR